MPSPKLVFLFAAMACAAVCAHAQVVDESRSYGLANQMYGVSASYAPYSGDLWGYTTNTRMNEVRLQYGINLTHASRTRLRFTPEIVPFASLLERAPSETNPAAPIRSYGVGAKPVGLELSTLRGHRVQPFLTQHEGFLYYNRRVLSPGGSQFMFTLDFGIGTRIFTSKQNAILVQYHYDHESNANISLHNPGTDGHTISVGFTHYRRR